MRKVRHGPDLIHLIKNDPYQKVDMAGFLCQIERNEKVGVIIISDVPSAYRTGIRFVFIISAGLVNKCPHLLF